MNLSDILDGAFKLLKANWRAALLIAGAFAVPVDIAVAFSRRNLYGNRGLLDYADLLKRELIAQEQYDQFRTTAEALTATVRADATDVKSALDTVMADEAAVKSAEETVRADQAIIDNARVQLGYATIRSPIDGRTGSLLLHEGNVVRATGTNDSTLLTINPQASMKIAQPVSPWLNSQNAAGSHTSGGPIGTGDRKNVASPSSGAAGTPAIMKPIPARMPCSNAVPRMP